jgi:hypothetical protein
VPFTGSHPAAVLPFLRTPLPASALVAGSMAPRPPVPPPVDVGLAAHTALAAVSTDLVLGGLLWGLWHGLVAAPASWRPHSSSRWPGGSGTVPAERPGAGDERRRPPRPEPGRAS